MLEGRLTPHGVEKPIYLQIRLTTRGRKLRTEGKSHCSKPTLAYHRLELAGERES